MASTLKRLKSLLRGGSQQPLPALSPQSDVREIALHANAFKQVLDGFKREHRQKGLEWYPYNTLANFQHFDRLLNGPRRRLLELIGHDTVLDIGCGDGDLAFFLESLGCRVQVMDHPVTNHNHMEGVHRLKQLLQSDVKISAVDLDGHFLLPGRRHSVAFLLGVLYHLKNPFYVLELLSKHVQYCIVSTRIAKLLPGKAEILSDVPVAYLLNDRELNDDNTNYWIFTDSGLRRLLVRTNWEVLDYVTIGDTTESDATSLRRDERAFCLLRSRYSLANVEFLYGWHAAEEFGWRWTEKQFAFRSAVENGVRQLRMEFFIPPFVIEQFGSLTLQPRTNGEMLRPQTYTAAGNQVLLCPLPAAASVEVCFTLDHAIEPDESDLRQRGIIVASVNLERM